MKTIYLLLSIALFSLPFAEAADPIDDSSQNVNHLVNAYNNTGFDLMRECQKNIEEHENLVVSPLSIALAMTMTSNGAVGLTQEEMLEALNLDELDTDAINQANQVLLSSLLNSEDETTLNIANSLWHREDANFNTSYKELCATNYQSEVNSFELDNEKAKEAINNWVAGETNDLITNLIERVTPEHLLFIINAIYFKGDWKTEFDPAFTHDQNFTATNGALIKVPTMSEMMYNCAYSSNEKFEMIDLLFSESKYSMLLLLPKGEETANKIIVSLDDAQISSAINNSTPKTVKIDLPKFKLDYKKDIKDDFKNLGIQQAFNGSSADFSDMITSPKVYISEIIHQSVFDLHEGGVEAAAATSVGMSYTSIPSPDVSIQFNKPFLFVLRHTKTNTNLFIGKVTNPQNEDINESPQFISANTNSNITAHYNKEAQAIILSGMDNENFDQEMSAELVDLSGRKVKSWKYINSTIPLSTNECKGNIYLLKIHSSNNSQSFKVLVN